MDEAAEGGHTEIPVCNGRLLLQFLLEVRQRHVIRLTMRCSGDRWRWRPVELQRSGFPAGDLFRLAPPIRDVSDVILSALLLLFEAWVPFWFGLRAVPGPVLPSRGPRPPPFFGPELRRRGSALRTAYGYHRAPRACVPPRSCGPAQPQSLHPAASGRSARDRRRRPRK